MNSKTHIILATAFILVAFFLFSLFNSRTLPKQGSYQLFEHKKNIFLLDQQSGKLWEKGGTLNGITQWTKQEIPGLAKENSTLPQRYRLILREEGYYLLDSVTGQLWEQGGTLNGLRLWIEQKITH